MNGGAEGAGGGVAMVVDFCYLPFQQYTLFFTSCYL